MKANIFRKMWIMTSAAIIFFCVCSKLVFLSFVGKLTRARANKAMCRACELFLIPVNLTFTVLNPHKVDITDGKRYIIMINHSSHYDIPLSMLALPGTIRMVGKKELFSIPLLGFSMRKGEHVKIDRKDRAQAVKDLKYAKELMESGVTIWMAPEGTRSKDGKLAPFKKGGFFLAMESQAYIIPIGIRGANDVLAANTLDFYLNKKAELHIGEPIYAGDYDVSSRDELIARVRGQLKVLADVEFSEGPTAVIPGE